MAKPNNQARTEFASALNQVCSERGIEPKVVLESIKQAILAAFRKDTQIGEEELETFSVKLNPNTGEAQVTDINGKDVTPPDFGRIAAQTAKQVILQRVREAEKDAIIDEYQDKIGTIVNGMILRFEGKTAVIDIGRAQAIMPPEEQAADEYYRLNQRLAVFIKEIRETPHGQKVIVSRSSSELVTELFSREVPEISSGSVKIIAIAREAGRRTKIAVDSNETSVDPVGSCVGQKGVRVQAVINQLGGEKIDIIQYNKDPIEFIRTALSPAEGLVVKLDKKNQKAAVAAPEDQQSIAIGRGGQNVRLASKLTGWEIDITGNDKPVAPKPENNSKKPAKTAGSDTKKKSTKKKPTKKTATKPKDE